MGSISEIKKKNKKINGVKIDVNTEQTFKKAHLAGGGTPTPDAINTAWNNISTSAKNAYNSLTKSNLNTHKNDIVT